MREQMQKKFLFIVMLSLLFIGTKIVAYAGNGPNPSAIGYPYLVLIDESSVDGDYLYKKDGKAVTVNKASYDKKTNTLTLNNYQNPKIRIIANEMGEDFKIKLVGTNKIAQIYIYGYEYGGSVALTGEGTFYINENKTYNTPILLDAEISNARFSVGENVNLKAYSKKGFNTVEIRDTLISSKGILFEKNDILNKKVVQKKYNADTYQAVNCLDETSTFYKCTPKDSSDKKEYVARKMWTESGEYYAIYELIRDDKLGILAIETKLDAKNYAVNEDITLNAYGITNFTSYLMLCTLNSNSNDKYGCKYIVNEKEEKLYSMYQLVEKYNKLFAVPIKGQQNISREDLSILNLYTSVKTDLYNYSLSIEESTCVNGHKKQTTIKKATTKKDGKKVVTCSVCKKTLSTTVIPKVSTIQLSTSTYTYNGKIKTPTVIVKDKSGKKIVASNYTISYAKGRKNVGSYEVKVNLKGNYTGNIKKAFTIVPKGTSLSKLTTSKKAISVKWKKQATQTTGYQIQYSIDKKFKRNVTTLTVNKSKTTNKTITKLKSKTTYYLKIRTYKTENKKIYSSWSKVSSIKVK